MLAVYIKEVASRIEQYWCPIEHVRRELQALRTTLAQLDAAEKD